MNAFTILYEKNKKLYQRGMFGWLSFVNYSYNKKYYKGHKIIKTEESNIKIDQQ